MTFDRSNLIVLMYAHNNCYTTVVLPDDPVVQESGASIDEKNGTWTAPRNGILSGAPQTQKIGGSRYIEYGCRHGVIGVYDRTKLEHLNLMVHASSGATHEPDLSAD